MDDHQRSDGIPVTRFTLLSIYAQSDDEKLEFEYESGNTNILANDYTSQPEISHQGRGVTVFGLGGIEPVDRTVFRAFWAEELD
ncbi:coiled-coil domain-containing protein mad1 [Sarracenia purpurea var. burkii]